MDGNASGEDSCDMDWSTDEETYIGNDEASSSMSVPRSKLIRHFVEMGFPEELVLRAIEENGEDDSDAILNSIIMYLPIEDSPPQQLGTTSDMCTSDCNETYTNDLSDMDSWTDDEIEDCSKGNGDYIPERHRMLRSLEESGSLTENEKKLLNLANMGYGLQDAETAMVRWPEASVAELIDFICAAQMAREVDSYLPEDDLKPQHLPHGGRSKNKKMKKKVTEESSDSICMPNPMIGYGVPSIRSERVQRSLARGASGPPYFYYENVAFAPKGVWEQISRFLHDIEPEFVDSKFFSACARKRGYVHNLPIEGRFPLEPLPPLTIQQAFPSSGKWWPTWDPRVKLNCIQTAMASAPLSERIHSVLQRHEGEPPESVKRYVLEECRRWNLIWVGKNKVARLECNEVEMLMGFPEHHTRGISMTDRYKALGNAFQVNTVAYHLSVLKDLYPNGINVLSLFTGIGGAEVALDRLGVKLKNVVSIEKSKVNRNVVRSWWEGTQRGTLVEFHDVQQFSTGQIAEQIDRIGGFDLVIGGSPCNNLAGGNRYSRYGLEGQESALFFDYFRILHDVQQIMRNRR